MSSGIICSNSCAIVEESMAPLSKASSNTSFNFLGSFVLPTRSSNNILKLSATDAPDPTCPFAVANMAAVVMLRICVIKDKTVLFICIPALIASADFIKGNFNS